MFCAGVLNLNRAIELERQAESYNGGSGRDIPTKVDFCVLEELSIAVYTNCIVRGKTIKMRIYKAKQQAHKICDGTLYPKKDSH